MGLKRLACVWSYCSNRPSWGAHWAWRTLFHSDSPWTWCSYCDFRFHVAGILTHNTYWASCYLYAWGSLERLKANGLGIDFARSKPQLGSPPKKILTAVNITVHRSSVQYCILVPVFKRGVTVYVRSAAFHHLGRVAVKQEFPSDFFVFWQGWLQKTNTDLLNVQRSAGAMCKRSSVEADTCSIQSISEKGNSGGELPREARMCLGTKRNKIVLGILCGVFGTEVEGQQWGNCAVIRSHPEIYSSWSKAHDVTDDLFVGVLWSHACFREDGSSSHWQDD